MHTTLQKFSVGKIFKPNQGCIYLIKNTANTKVLRNIINI